MTVAISIEVFRLEKPALESYGASLTRSGMRRASVKSHWSKMCTLLVSSLFVNLLTRRRMP